jgi:NhaP-type Na+/H+ or K+/H+ antiporter
MRLPRPIALMLAGAFLASALGGCGVAETTVATGAASGAASRQAADAPRQLDQVKRDIDAAQKTDEAARAAAERSNTE